MQNSIILSTLTATVAVAPPGAAVIGLALVSTMINLAHSLTLKVVAEGVETVDQARLLRLVKCDQMQGYYFSRPVPADECTRLIRERRTLPIRNPDLAKPVIVRA